MLVRVVSRHLAAAVTRIALAVALPCLLAACGPGISAPHPTGATTAPTAQGRTLVVLGASDAYGVGTNDPDRDNWPTSLARQLHGQIHLVNLGVPGATLERAATQELPI